MAKESMMVITSKWNDKATFKLISTSNECPFNEAIYDPDQKVLAVISKTKYTKPHMLPKLDNHGRPKTIKGKNADGQLVEMQTSERLFVDAFYEYYIEDEADIRSFISHFAINSSHSSINIMNDTEAKVEKKATKKKATTAKA